MPTITAGTVATVYCPLASTITITPGTAGRVSFQARSASGGQSAAPRELYSAETVSVSAGDTVTMEAINTDATYTTPAGGDAALSALVSKDGYPGPALVAHRAASQLYPENSLSGMQAAYAAGFRYIEFDVQTLLNGNGMGVMHDTTVDRTTSGTGNVNSFTPTTWAALTLDPLNPGGTAVAAGGYRPEAPPTLDQVLNWAADNIAILVIEPKATTDIEPLIAALEARQWPKDRVIIEWQNGSAADLASVIAAGYTCWRVITTATESNIDAAATAGFRHFGTDFGTWTTSLVNYCRSKGMTPWAYTVDRRFDYAALIAAGFRAGDFIVSGDPAYLQWGLSGKRLTKLPKTGGIMLPGMIGGTTGASADAARGRWGTDGNHGWPTAAQADHCLMGCLAPINGDAGAAAFTITAKVKFTSVSAADRWLGIHCCAPDDRGYQDAVTSRAGYNFIIRQDGRVQIYRTPPTGSSTQIATNGTAGALPCTLGTEYTITITVTATTVRIAGSNGNDTGAIADATYRGGYLHTGRNGCDGYLMIDSIT